MSKKFTKSYLFRTIGFLGLTFIGFQSIFYPELTNKWFIQGLGVLWLIDACNILIKMRIKYLKDRIKKMENEICQTK